jgi:hypothetical protein
MLVATIAYHVQNLKITSPTTSTSHSQVDTFLSLHRWLYSMDHNPKPHKWKIVVKYRHGPHTRHIQLFVKKKYLTTMMEPGNVCLLTGN